MSDTYDTYGDGTFEAEVSADGDCCCCCDSAVAGEAAYEAGTSPSELLGYDAPVGGAAQVSYDAPEVETYEPVEATLEEPVYQPIAEAAPVVAFSEPAPAPLADAPVNGVTTVGGPDPFGGMTIVGPAGDAVDPAALIAGASTIGGADPFGGMTIVGADGNAVDPSVLVPAEGVIGPSSPVIGHGFTMVPDPNAPVYANPMPRVPLAPSPDDSINDIAVRHATTMAALNSLSRAQNPNP